MSTIVTAPTAAEWRAWLAEHAPLQRQAWLVIHHRSAGVPSLTYATAIEQALCFGWIDSVAHKHDAHSSRLRFTPRDPRSTWSAVNRRRAAQMIEQGLMTAAGQALIDHAKATGRWEVTLDDTDLRAALGNQPAALNNFEAFPPSSKRLILTWIAAAKRPETRQRRIATAVEQAALNLRAV